LDDGSNLILQYMLLVLESKHFGNPSDGAGDDADGFGLTTA